MSTYKTGTVSVSNGNAIVTGSGTAWAVALVAGGVFSSAGLAVPIASVDSDTQLTLDYPWPGTTASGAAYSIALENSEAASVANLNSTLSRVLVTLSLAGITPNASGTLTERDALTLAVGDKGFLFLHAEVGVAFAFYRWTGTAWDGPFTQADAVAGGGVTSIVAGTNVTVDNTNPQIPVISASGTPVQTAVHAATSKTTPVDADEMALVDSAASWGLKKLTWANLKATLWAAWGALTSAGTAKTTPVDADLFAIADSAASNATKKLTWANLKAALAATSFTWTANQTINASFLTLQSSAQFLPQMVVAANYNGAEASYINFQKTRGGAAVSVNDNIGTFVGQAYSNGALRNAAAFGFSVTDVGSTYVSGRIDFNTDQGGSTATRMSVQSGVSVGNPTGGDKGSGTVNAATNYYVNGVLISPPGAPVTKSADFSVAATETNIIVTKGSSCTATLPAAASFPGREIEIKTTVAFTTVSASSNVVPKTGGAAGTAILPATAGAWARLVSDGTNWIIMQSGT